VLASRAGAMVKEESASSGNVIDVTHFQNNGLNATEAADAVLSAVTAINQSQHSSHSSSSADTVTCLYSR
jgi:hypothetical protein